MYKRLMLNVITLNAANYDDVGNWEKRKEMICNTISSNDADIVALQEIRFDAHQESTKLSYQNMGEQILTELSTFNTYENSSIVYQWAQYYENGSTTQQITTTWEGLAVISRRPIVETGTMFLSMPENSGDKNHRITLYTACYPDSGGVFYLFNTHFAVYDWCPTCVTLNVTETVKYMNRFGSFSRLLVGDLNATPDNPEIQRLAESGFIDVWANQHPQDSGYTYPSKNPQKRIDYVWADKALAESVKSVELICTQPDACVYASDHVGLLVKLSI